MRRSFALVALLPAAAGAFAQPQLAPGLWEHSFQMKGGGAETDAAMAKMQKEMAAMPPEQRKMIEQMMSSRGVKIGANGTSTTVQVCMTKEQVSRDQVPMDSRCTQQNVQRSGNTMRFKFACTGERPTSGEGEYTFTDDKSYSGRSTIDTTVDGKPQRMEVQKAGKWLGADCGSVKPRP
jgi:hypothetical protein